MTSLAVLGVAAVYLLARQAAPHVARAESAAPCNDERDTLIVEYTTYRVNLRPVCVDFTRDAHSEHFTFAELNGGDFPWAILRGDLLRGLENIRARNGDAPLRINSGYRNPRHNAGITGAARQSQHMYGTAADIASTETTWQVLHDHAKGSNACVEPLDVSGVGHVHVDWRGPCPSRW
ncbi:MAG TPA: D-Ala-D-Ala carboxypeptidase family metallohydrolase [Pyrinomonadaceae bacterium]